jgi:putative transposase
MTKKEPSKRQIIEMLEESKQGACVGDLCRKYNILPTTYYRLKSQYDGINTSELRQTKTLEKEYQQLKVMYAELSLEHHILKELMRTEFQGTSLGLVASTTKAA